jgi:hypothetical protein
VRIIADADADAKEYCTVYNRHRGKKKETLGRHRQSRNVTNNNKRLRDGWRIMHEAETKKTLNARGIAELYFVVVESAKSGCVYLGRD